MPDERLDIVDENNEPTGGSELRSKSHTSGLWHRTVHIYVYRKKGGLIEFLVHLRSSHKDLHPNKWDTRFGGHLKSGETYEQAVAGELKDEIGLDVDGVTLVKGALIKRENFPNNEFAQIHYCQFTGDEKQLRFNDGEVQKVEWISTDEILKRMREQPDEWTSQPEYFQGIIRGVSKSTERNKWHTDNMPEGYPQSCDDGLLKAVAQDLNDEYIAKKNNGKHNPIWEGIISRLIQSGQEELQRRKGDKSWFSMNNPIVYILIVIILALVAYAAYKLGLPLKFGLG
jgi:isopentenyldiphosphate isomerase